ncbi:MAG TPA: chitobiase/beta-hexosaminidase C-terminal domain-containing protein [Kofleriaceae bacterium]|nr:chitobiase/beta-hexosaminidase C-terminal domain-containing protein [Kofleriaceae bacterium]
MLRGLLVISTLLLLLDGCSGGECGDGTFRYGDTCVAVDPFDKTPPKVAVDPPLYTRAVGIVRLTADEPSTIYYTIDGTSPTTDSSHEDDVVVVANVPDNAQLRYFAVDRNGNRSAEELRIWIIDRNGPGAPIDFRLALSGSSRSLTWVTPPDPRLGGVMIARVDGPLAAGPESGTAYAVGDTISPGVQVVSLNGTDTAGAFNESVATSPGLVRYIAWAFDDLHNYGPPAGDYAVVPMAAQSAAVSVTANTNATFSITTPPSLLNLTGDAQYTSGNQTLTVHLTLRNDTARVLYAPKLVLKTALPGTVAFNKDGDYNAKPYRAYGAALLPAQTTQQTWTFTNVTSGTTLNLGLDFVDGQIAGTSAYRSDSAGQIVDFNTGVQLLQLAALPMGNGGDGMMIRGGFTPDGKLICGSRTAGAVSRYDLVSGSRELTAELKPQKAHVPAILLDKSGSAVYALLAEGHPYNINNNSATAGATTELVMLDAGSLQIGARLPIGPSRNRGIEISPDGRLMLIATGLQAQGVIVVDLTQLTIKTRIIPPFRPQVALFAPDGSIVIVGEQVAVYTQEGNRTALWETPGTGGKVVRAAFGSPTLLWIGRRDQLEKLDIRDGVGSTVTLPPGNPTPPTLGGRIVEVFDGKLYAMAGSDIVRLDANATTIEKTLDGFDDVDAHWFGRSPF